MPSLVRFDLKLDQVLGQDLRGFFVLLHGCCSQQERTSGNKDLGGGRVLLPHGSSKDLCKHKVMV